MDHQQLELIFKGFDVFLFVIQVKILVYCSLFSIVNEI